MHKFIDYMVKFTVLLLSFFYLLINFFYYYKLLQEMGKWILNLLKYHSSRTFKA